ncbi:protein FAR1-RELATED SEQUENCE 6-like [Dendrobium catenatum]|uniref:protein FAR1-RELATED SEQUENCE 6-like n=1 Tax=Dendrobium catenatum TaxID=906689 RepID=UPI0009F4AC0C|nr:protein FAR1-RELATED SEQUENCE 6-like [Dendrobium catenatum]
MDCSAKREVEEGMEEGVHESERMHESEGLVHESESEPNLAGNSSGFDISAIYKDETEAYECFCTYAHDNGFSVRKDHHSFWPNSRKIKSKDFVCSKAGFKKSYDLNSRKRFTRPDVRTGCPAMVRFVTDEDGYWHVKRFFESYNHKLSSPADRHLLRSCRNVVEEKASVLKSMIDAGIRTVDAYAYLAEKVGECENIGFSKRDAYNFTQKEKRARIEIDDTNSLIQLFKDRLVEDHMFTWDVQYDD